MTQNRRSAIKAVSSRRWMGEKPLHAAATESAFSVVGKNRYPIIGD